VIKTIAIHQLSDLPEAAIQLLRANPGKKIFAFRGEMGVGKTTFIKILCETLGVLGHTSSPTYSLVNEYEGQQGVRICHFDFYRISNPAEALDMGFEEYLDSGAFCFIEWPEKVHGLLPAESLNVEMKRNGEERSISFRISA
jgi:tRNA threonylcarbamoyladenosine biosynthesis protein TsaE